MLRALPSCPFDKKNVRVLVFNERVALCAYVRQTRPSYERSGDQANEIKCQTEFVHRYRGVCECSLRRRKIKSCANRFDIY